MEKLIDLIKNQQLDLKSILSRDLQEIPLNWATWDWSQLFSHEDFEWVDGITPFSNIEVSYW
jgi:hypothetical protein